MPQSSVLGPLLFCMHKYMNDLKDHLELNGTFILLNADDHQIYVQFPVNEIEQGILCLSESDKRVAKRAELFIS